MGETSDRNDELVHLVRLALSEQTEDVRLYVARLVQRYRNTDLALAKQIELHLRTKPAGANTVLRKHSPTATPTLVIPADDESRLTLLRPLKAGLHLAPPLLPDDVKHTLDQLILERREAERLTSKGLSPTRSAVFVGPPGVGKTLTAHWLASQLEVPVYVLDLSAVMSCLLGRSGANLRSAFDFAKRTPCVLLLDEIDAIAKRRSDDSDVGELKRLVTVILQEIDEWPSTGLLLAATNHPELIDPALWRRFDMIVTFKLPEMPAVKAAIARFLGPDYPCIDPPPHRGHRGSTGPGPHRAHVGTGARRSDF